MMMKKYMVEKWERERQNGLYAVVRGRLEEARAVRNVLMLASLLATRNQGDKWAMILPQPESMVTSTIHVETKAVGMSRV